MMNIDFLPYGKNVAGHSLNMLFPKTLKLIYFQKSKKCLEILPRYPPHVQNTW